MTNDVLQEQARPSALGWWLRVCRYRILLALSVFVGWALMTGFAWFVPAKYRSETLILVEQQRVPEHYVEPNVALDLQQRLQSMSEQILSRTRLLSIIEKFHLYDIDRHAADTDSLIETMRKDINLDLVRADTTRPNQIAAFKISYSARTPVLAQQVTSELTSLFIEENLRNRQQLSEDTTTFLETQLDEARRNLERQEDRLREFKSRYLGQLPEQTATNMQILGGLQTRLESATQALHAAQQQRLYLESLLNNYRMLAAQSAEGDKTGGLPPTYELDAKLKQLRAQLADLNTKYTSAHPDVIRLKQEVATTEKIRAQAEEQAESAKLTNSKDTSPNASAPRMMSPTMQVESQLKANEFEIANRQAEIKSLEKQIEGYQEKLNLAPAREQELAAITRDHEQSRVNYDSLLAKKNQSEMATNLEKRQQGEQFRMIDPPSLPQRPYFPNRLAFSLGGLAVGLLVGLAFVVVMELRAPIMYGEQELRAVVDASVFVTIPVLPIATEERRRRQMRILEGVAGATMLLLVSVVTFVLYQKG